jgi:Zn-dependent peptidase ImmA (M78 family)
MRRIEELCDEAQQYGIEVEQEAIPIPNMDAAYINTDYGKLIVLRADGTTNEKTCWLAEELGHHVTGTDLALHYNTAADWKAEAHARRWAHMRLLTPDAVRTAARNTDDIYEIAEALDVSVEFLQESIDDFQAKGLWSSVSSGIS